MKIIVLGAGAIGGVYAAKLSARHEVTLLARPSHAEAINRDGLRVVGLEETTCAIRAVTAVDAVPPGALVLLTTKVNDNRSTIESIGSWGPDATIVCVQNGLGGEEIVRQALASRAASEPASATVRVIRAVTQFGAIFREPGIIDYKVAGHTLLEDSDRSAAIAAVLTDSGLDGRVSSDINVDVWRKLIFNCVINPITAIMGTEV